jgi:alkanesulfonate monooxygenase SsuD/methylene tetrahydromethanopterin reductase-like flavin-dependent oxidoreductase (luciferase family)
MEAQDLQRWLEDHVQEIFQFMDYEATIESDEQLAVTLGYWLGDENWREQTDHRFVHLGIDGTGSQVAAWMRPEEDGPPPIVFFGSEGGVGVLTATPLNWALLIAHAPWLNEYPSDGGPARAVALDDVDDDGAEALADYRDAVTERFGELPSFDDLTSDIDDLNEAFEQWVSDIVG